LSFDSVVESELCLKITWNNQFWFRLIRIKLDDTTAIMLFTNHGGASDISNPKTPRHQVVVDTHAADQQ
jgi:hypothetical protein